MRICNVLLNFFVSVYLLDDLAILTSKTQYDFKSVIYV